MYDNNRINLYKNISESQKKIREKYLKFKRGIEDIKDSVSYVFKPIINPLNELVYD